MELHSNPVNYESGIIGISVYGMFIVGIFDKFQDCLNDLVPLLRNMS